MRFSDNICLFGHKRKVKKNQLYEKLFFVFVCSFMKRKLSFDFCSDTTFSYISRNKISPIPTRLDRSIILYLSLKILKLSLKTYPILQKIRITQNLYVLQYFQNNMNLFHWLLFINSNIMFYFFSSCLFI